jgi:hypothetical protein
MTRIIGAVVKKPHLVVAFCADFTKSYRAKLNDPCLDFPQWLGRADRPPATCVPSVLLRMKSTWSRIVPWLNLKLAHVGQQTYDGPSRLRAKK